MSGRGDRPPVRSSTDEPAASGIDARIPDVASWQRAAEMGASTDVAPGETGQAATEQGVRLTRAPWTPASAGLPGELYTAIIDWCRGGLPNEACGLLVGDRVAEDGGLPLRFIGLRNVAASPYRYLIDPDEQLRVMLEIDDADQVIWGIVHSHVASPPVPSATDVGLAAYPDALYLICSLADPAPALRAWTIQDGAISEVVLEPV